MNNIKDNILKQIKTKEIDMIPRWHFVMRTIFLLAGVVLVSLIAVYLLSFVFFVLHRTGLVFAPTFGPKGLVMLVVSSPWLLIMVLGLFLCALYVLVTKYSFSYQKPLVYTMVGVVLAVIAVSSFIEQLAIHERVYQFADDNNVPGLAPLYREHLNRQPKGVLIGTIEATTTEGFTLLDEVSGETKAVEVAETARLHPALTNELGERVMVFGEEEEGTVTAFGVRPADDGFGPPPGGRGMRRFNNVPPPDENEPGGGPMTPPATEEE